MPSSGHANGGGQPRIDTSVAHSARVHDYWLGGKDNFAADRAAGDAVMAAYPGIVQSVRANRAFLARAVRFLAAEADRITAVRRHRHRHPRRANNTHEVAQAATPAASVGCTSTTTRWRRSTPACSAARSTAPGTIDYIDADLRDPGDILAAAARTLDYTRPVAVMRRSRSPRA